MIFTVHIGLGLPRNTGLDNCIELDIEAASEAEARDRAGEIIGQDVGVVFIEADLTPAVRTFTAEEMQNAYHNGYATGMRDAVRLRAKRPLLDPDADPAHADYNDAEREDH